MIREKSDIKILIVEDNDSNYLLAKIILKEYRTSRAVNGIEAIEQVMGDMFDVVFMDVNMPVMDGLEATRKIREFNKDIPIFAVTAKAFDSDRTDALDAGCNGFITKPINQRELIQIVKDLCV